MLKTLRMVQIIFTYLNNYFIRHPTPVVATQRWEEEARKSEVRWQGNGSYVKEWTSPEDIKCTGRSRYDHHVVLCRNIGDAIVVTSQKLRRRAL